MNRFVLFLAIGSSSVGHASSDIQGTWRLDKQACASGAAPKDTSPELNISLNAITEISDARMDVTYTLQMKFTDAYAAKQLELLKTSYSRLGQPPEGSDQKKTEWMNTFLMSQYIEGVSCTARQSASYAYDGRELNVGSFKLEFSDCPGQRGETDEAESERSVVEVKDGVMTVTTLEDDTDGPCVQGDHQVSTWTHIPTVSI